MIGKHMRGQLLYEGELPYESGICEYCNSWLNFLGSITKELSCPFCGNELEVTNEKQDSLHMQCPESR